MASFHRTLPIVAGLIAATALPGAGQYRRQAEELAPLYGATLSVGSLFSFEETLTSVVTPQPEEERRGLRSIGAAPAVSASFRYGRGLAVYASGLVAFTEDAELSGTDPLTGAPLDGTADAGLVGIASVGVSFTPLRSLVGLRIELGPSWVDLGEGGSYLGVRIGASARLVDISDRGGVLLGWDGFFAGGQDDRGEVEHQIRGGFLSGVRLGYEMEF